MAFTLCLKQPVTPSPLRFKQIIYSNPSFLYFKPTFTANFSKLELSSSETRNQVVVRNAAQDGGGSEAAEEEGELLTEANVGGEPGKSGGELGMEIKRAMMERKAKEAEDGGGLWGGVAEEIGEIQWPAFGKVLGTTGVVLGVIAGSSVVLLTLNAVLAELSDRVFAGRGVQDFFG